MLNFFPNLNIIPLPIGGIFLHSFFSYLLTKSHINFKEETFYKDFSPPDFNPDIQALYQVYIIWFFDFLNKTSKKDVKPF